MSDEQAAEQPEIIQAETPETQEAGQAEAEQEEQADLEAQLAQAQVQVAEYLDGWQRARAELANYKKRVERERDLVRTQLRGDVIAALLPVLDDLDRAMETLPPDLDGHEWVEGLRLIHRKFQTGLTEMGVVEIEAAGQPFDPERHEAVMQRSDPAVEPGMVLEVLRKGYLIDNRVLRAAMVVVST